MVRRVIGGVTYTLTYDAENNMTGYSGDSVNASFVYDGDGRRVRATVNGDTTTFVGNYVEWKNSTSDMVRYYYVGGVRVAMRSGADDLVWLVGDHLGSTSIAVNNSSGQTERQLYKAWGETRFGDLPTNYRYTGQYEQPEIGLYYYGGRWYDPYLNRWAQPDSIIPEPYNPLAYDRYSYVYGNPVRYTDSSGHCIDGVTTLACVAIIGSLALKAFDYGWTAFDIFSSARVLLDPNAGVAEKILAAINVALAFLFESLEPDDAFPVGLPLDDIARRALIGGAKDALEEGGAKALEKFIRGQLGDNADKVLGQIDKLLGFDKVKFPTKPGQVGHIFRNSAGHIAEDILTNRQLFVNTVSWKNYVFTDKWGNQVFRQILDDGREVWVYVRDGMIRDAGINLIPWY